MKMKKIAICIMAACLSLTFIPLQAKDVVKPSTLVTTSKSAEVKELDLRLNEIKSMDKSKLTVSEKKSLRKEVKTTKQRLYNDYGVVYISAGTLLLIVILLIILL
jgi:hypothetical protein